MLADTIALHPQHIQAAEQHTRQRDRLAKELRDIRQLLDQAGYTIQPGPHRLTSLDDLYRIAIAAAIVIPSETKTAC
jgi:hypothetical protein